MRTIDESSIADALGSSAELIPVPRAHTVVPESPGYYSIVVDEPNNLPDPFCAHLLRKRSSLLYIGIATTSLVGRLVEEDLQHKRPSTFFRGVGAILGFRPPPGSLIGKRNQNNYAFSANDTREIIAWTHEHLAVRFVAIDTTEFPSAEKYAIYCHRPILNTTYNPERLSALADLRKQCRSVACRPV